MKNHYKIAKVNPNKIWLLVLGTVLLSFTTKVNAQLNPLSSQYFLNQYQVNPAYAGFNPGFNVNLNYRKQWSNLPGSPTTQAITADYKLNKIGLGINVYNEKAGSLQRTKAIATYAYHLKLNDNNQQLSFGVSGGLSNERVNYDGVNGDPTDMSIAQFNDKGTVFDGDLGIAYTSNNFNIEGVLPNIRSLIKQENRNNVDRSVFYAAMSYKINAGSGVSAIEIEPKIAYRGLKGYDNLFDIGTNVNFANKVFLMGMYHSSESASFGAGFNYKSSFAIMGYYTTETSSLQGATNGTFEISLKATLFK